MPWAFARGLTIAHRLPVYLKGADTVADCNWFAVAATATRNNAHDKLVAILEHWASGDRPVVSEHDRIILVNCTTWPAVNPPHFGPSPNSWSWPSGIASCVSSSRMRDYEWSLDQPVRGFSSAISDLACAICPNMRVYAAILCWFAYHELSQPLSRLNCLFVYLLYSSLGDYRVIFNYTPTF